MSDTLLTEAIRFMDACNKAAEIEFISPECRQELKETAVEISRRIARDIDKFLVVG